MWSLLKSNSSTTTGVAAKTCQAFFRTWGKRVVGCLEWSEETPISDRLLPVAGPHELGLGRKLPLMPRLTYSRATLVLFIALIAPTVLAGYANTIDWEALPVAQYDVRVAPSLQHLLSSHCSKQE